MNVHIFHKSNVAEVAAVEYVIRKYENKEWFNGLLVQTLINMRKKSPDKLFKPPLIFISYDQYNISLVKGYHYIIDTIQKYNVNNNNIIFCKKLISILVIVYLIFFIIFLINITKKTIKLK